MRELKHCIQNLSSCTRYSRVVHYIDCIHYTCIHVLYPCHILHTLLQNMHAIHTTHYIHTPPAVSRCDQKVPKVFLLRTNSVWQGHAHEVEVGKDSLLSMARDVALLKSHL